MNGTQVGPQGASVYREWLSTGPFVGLQARSQGSLALKDYGVHVPARAGSCFSKTSSSKGNLDQDDLQHREFNPLQNVDLVLRPGEVCLVLGTNGSGKDVLLRSLGGKLNPTDEVIGEMKLGGRQMRLSSSDYKSRVGYMARDVSSATLASLTVRETLTFAASLSPTIAKDDTDRAVDAMLEALNLKGVQDELVRKGKGKGISVGEQRRLAFAEMVLASSPSTSLFLLEDPAAGLDAVQGFELLKLLANVCRQMKISALIAADSLSEDQFNLFDSLLCLNSMGEQTFFGETSEAVSYFERYLEEPKPEEVNSAEYLVTAASDLQFHQDGTVSVFDNEKSAAMAWQMSKERGNIKTLAEQVSSVEVREDFGSVGEQALHEPSRLEEFGSLAWRQGKLMKRNPMQVARITFAVLYGLVMGSLYKELDPSTFLFGEIGTEGYIFLTLTLLAFTAASATLSMTYSTRDAVFQQLDKKLYRTVSYYIAVVLMDLLFAFVEVSLIVGISYFWVGLRPGAKHFLYFWFTMFFTEAWAMSLARILPYVIPGQVKANHVVTAIVGGGAATAGFLPSYQDLQGTPWFWVNWMMPQAYAFEGLVLNQFADFEDDESGVKLLLGSFPRADWASDRTIWLFDLFILPVFAIVLDIVAVFMLTSLRHKYHHQTGKERRMFTFGNKSFVLSQGKESVEGPHDGETSKGWKERRPEHVESSARFPRTSADLESGSSSSESVSLAVEDMSYRNLCDITGHWEAGTMNAVIGESGSGKTTLLNVLSGTSKQSSGRVMVGGQEQSQSELQGLCGYAEQKDVLSEWLTVRESVEMFAQLSMPKELSEDDKQAKVDKAIVDLKLEDWANVRIGSGVQSVPGHVLKRAAIAGQLVREQRVLLLDEPTMNLDAVTADIVLQAVKSVVIKRDIVCLASIHNPHQSIISNFETLTVLEDGALVYLGENGMHFAEYIERSTKERFEADEGESPAVFGLKKIKQSGQGKLDLAAEFRLSSEYETVVHRIKEDCREAITVQVTDNKPGFFHTLKTMVKRQWRVTMRDMDYSRLNIASSLGAGIVIGSIFWQLDNSILSVFARIGAIFYAIFMMLIPIRNMNVPLFNDRAVFYKETSSGLYSGWTYALARVPVDALFSFFTAVLFAIPFYLMIGLREGTEYFGYFVLALAMTNYMLRSFGKLLGALTPNTEFATVLGGLVTILLAMLMGFIVPALYMPSYYNWAYMSNMIRYSLQGLLINELQDVDLLLPINLGGDAGHASSGIYQADTLHALGVTVAHDSVANTDFAILYKDSKYQQQVENLITLVDKKSGPVVVALDDNVTEYEAPEEPGLEDLIGFLGCVVENECIQMDEEGNLDIGALIDCVFAVFGQAPCGEELKDAMDEIGVLVGCLAPGDEENATETETERRITYDELALMVHNKDAEEEAGIDVEDLLGCLVEGLLPDSVQSLLQLLQGLMQLLDVVKENGGLYIPANIILGIFGWVEFDPNAEDPLTPIANWKYYYCLFAVAMFLLAFELGSLLSFRYVRWDKP